MNKSVWRNVKLPRFPKVSESKRSQLQFDVVIVGGGITGLMTAYYLKQAGLTVCLLERDRLASGDTGSTTAHLTGVTDKRIKDLVSGYGEKKTRLVWDAGEIAISMMEKVVQEHDIACHYTRVPGYLHTSLTEKNAKDAESLRKECQLARDMGIDANFQESVPIVGLPGIRYSNQAKFHPLSFLAGVATRIPGGGSKIYEQSPVSKIEDGPLRVHCGRRVIHTNKVVIATNVPIMGKDGLVSASLFQTKIAPYSSYVIGAKIPKGKYPEVSLWDTTDPYYYLRVDKGAKHDYAIFGGKDHKTGQVSDTEQCYSALEGLLLGMMPEAKIDHRWSGQVIETHDGLPFMGEIAENQFIATGYCGNGFTFGTTAALMARDWILKMENPWADLFSPSRKEIRAGGALEYVKENLDYPAYLIADRLKPLDPLSTAELKKGEGKVLELKGERVACSRDLKGNLHVVSAVCPHLGCIVRWNNGERTWDCPCHGSRFKDDGTLIAGPAEDSLKPVSVQGQK